MLILKNPEEIKNPYIKLKSRSVDCKTQGELVLLNRHEAFEEGKQAVLSQAKQVKDLAPDEKLALIQKLEGNIDEVITEWLKDGDFVGPRWCFKWLEQEFPSGTTPIKRFSDYLKEAIAKQEHWSNTEYYKSGRDFG